VSFVKPFFQTRNFLSKVYKPQRDTEPNPTETAQAQRKLDKESSLSYLISDDQMAYGPEDREACTSKPSSRGRQRRRKYKRFCRRRSPLWTSDSSDSYSTETSDEEREIQQATQTALIIASRNLLSLASKDKTIIYERLSCAPIPAPRYPLASIEK